MPITKSAKKALRGTKRRQIKNLERKSAYKRAVKDVNKLTAEKRFEEARAKLALAFKTLDKAAKSNTIKKNKANRLKSRLAKRLAQSKT